MKQINKLNKFDAISSIALKDTKFHTKIKLQKKNKLCTILACTTELIKLTNLLVTAPKSFFWATTCVPGFE